MARVVVAGATGTIGRALTEALVRRGDQVVALSRNPAATLVGAEVHHWPDPKLAPPPPDALSGADAIVSLLGEPIAQRWSDAVKREIGDSRVLGTRSLVEAIRSLPDRSRPRTFVSQSATGYYGSRGEEALDESAPPGDDFLAGVVRDWEHEATAAAALTRVVLTRTGVVLSARSGALGQMLTPFRLGLGGPVAGGRQYVPWIHIDDVVGTLLECLAVESLEGPINTVAPNPVTNRELSKTLGRVLGRPAVLPVPELAVRVMFGEMSTVVTTGQRVIPARLLEAGYRFRQPELEAALRELLGR
jgi:uncharacterized protein (TIGR01777 family)